MTAFLRILLTASAMGAVTVIATLLLKKLLGQRLSANLHLWLWFPAILRFLMPYIPSTPLSVYNYIPHTITVNGALPVVESALQLHLVPALWLLGAAGSVLFAAVSYLRFVKSLVLTECSSEKLKTIATECAKKCKLKRAPQTVCCRNAISPMVVGLLSPKLVLPIPVMNQLSDEQIEIVFLHEYTHLARKDALCNLCLQMLICLHWFNPFAYLMRKKLREDLEKVCDDSVIQLLSENGRLLYSRTILDLTQASLIWRVNCITAPMASTKRTLKSRLEAICSSGKRKLNLLAIPSILILSLLFLTGAAEKPVHEAVGITMDLIDPITIYPSSMKSEAPSPVPSASASPTTLPTAENSASPTPSTLPTPVPSTEPASVPTPLPTSAPIPSTTPASAPVYRYSAEGASASFSDDRTKAGFSAEKESLTIATVGIRSSTSQKISGFFNIYENGILIAENLPATVTASPSAISFSGSGGQRYTFSVVSRTAQ